MRFSIEVGTKEVVTIEYRRNSFWGTESVRVNGERIAGKSALNPFTHVSMSLTKNLEFSVGKQELHEVRIEKIRPLIFAGFRPHLYRVYLDGKVFFEKKGY